MYFLLEKVDFHCYGSLPEGTSQEGITLNFLLAHFYASEMILKVDISVLFFLFVWADMKT